MNKKIDLVIHAHAAIVMALTVIVLIVAVTLDSSSSAVTAKVKGGEAALYCHMQDGWRQIPADKIEAFDGDRWVFTNGSASSCKVLEVGK